MQVKFSEAQFARAKNLLVDQVYRPVFFAKLAKYGFQPRTYEEAANFLKLAAFLRDLAARQYGPQAIRPEPPTPEYIDAARRFVEANEQIKAAAYVYTAVTE